MASQLLIGIVFETHETYPPGPGDPQDYAAEYEPLETIEALESAVGLLGHRSVRLGAPHALLAALGKGELPPIDAALSIAEGYGSRNREAWVAGLLEMADVPLLGSDGLSLSTSLDKVWAKQRVAAAGVPVAPHWLAGSADEARALASGLAYPVFVKPRWEGTAKGIAASSRVADATALEREVGRIVRDYAQPALIEAFLNGAEYTVTVVGHDPPRALPVLQRAIEVETRIGLHALGREAGAVRRHETPGDLGAEREAELVALGLQAFEALECRDFARMDFKLDDKGRAVFLEANPLPTFAADGSFGVIAELEGRSHTDCVAEVIGEALARLGLGPAA